MGEIQELVGRLHEGLGEDAARLFFGMEKPWPGSAREGASGCSAAPSPEIASGFVGDVREVDIVVSARDIARVWGAMRNASKQVAAHRSFQSGCGRQRSKFCFLRCNAGQVGTCRQPEPAAHARRNGLRIL